MNSEEESDSEDCQHEVYIMKVVVDGDTEEFVPADEDKLDTLAAIVEELLSECECDCDCEDDECGHHDHECSCGCHHDEK